MQAPTDSTNMLLRGQEVAVEVNEQNGVFMELAAGEMSLHHGLIFHGSDNNHSDSRRVGFAVRYMPPRVKPLDGLPRDSAMLVRGEDRYGYYDHEPSPKKELDPDAVSFHKKATDTYQAINRAAVNKHYEILKNQS